MLSIAEYLDRNGYNVLVDNLCERMVKSQLFDAKEHIKNLSAKVYAIGLHWCVHSQGAIEIARLCKELHPDAMVILGGLTATVFSEEIIYKCEDIDVVIQGEAEKPFLLLMNALKQNKKLEEVPNLTFRNSEGGVISNPLMQPCADLDEFEFTRLDLMEPKGAIFTNDTPPHWGVPICRGCVHNCVTCGGSRYSYRTYLGRKKPAFRSPQKIAEDIQKLSSQGANLIFLFQDPHMGGEEYWNNLFTTLRKKITPPIHLSMELFAPADEKYLKKLSKVGVPINLTISPESGVYNVRKAHGRDYTNEELLKTIKLCKKYDIRLGIHSMIALADDTPETIRKTWKTWEQICQINSKNQDIAPVLYAFGPMILLDPGSLAFDLPNGNGYRLIFKNFEDYYKGLSLPSWHQWISYETKHLNRDLITKLVIDSIEYSTNTREKYGFFSKTEADSLRYHYVTASKLVIDSVRKAANM